MITINNSIYKSHENIKCAILNFKIIERHKLISPEEKQIIENELYKIFSKYFKEQEE